jgi:hypothetical protein
LNGLRNELPIVRVHDPPQILIYGRGLAVWIEPVDPEQFRRPVVESIRAENPTAHICETLSLGNVELCLFQVFNFEIDANPIQQRSIAGPDWLRATEKPAVSSLPVSNSKTHLAGAAGAETD